MKSKASIKGHSIHSILVSFPIAFFIGTFVSDLSFFFSDKIIFREIAMYLEAGGIVCALAAAIPGIVDYYATVPPKSSAKERATKHGILNIMMLLVFTTALVLRRNAEINFLLILTLEGVGVIILSIAGWLGGTLVSRNQIGIDHRYANAGKWSEEIVGYFSGEMLELKDLEKLKVNQMKLIHVHHKRIVIARTETAVVAFADSCTHSGASLADGVMICETVQCPWHGSQFKVKTGSVVAGPAKEKIHTYEIKCDKGKYYLML